MYLHQNLVLFTSDKPAICPAAEVHWSVWCPGRADVASVEQDVFSQLQSVVDADNRESVSTASGFTDRLSWYKRAELTRESECVCVVCVHMCVPSQTGNMLQTLVLLLLQGAYGE